MKKLILIAMIICLASVAWAANLQFSRLPSMGGGLTVGDGLSIMKKTMASVTNTFVYNDTAGITYLNTGGITYKDY
ncbi:MAG: hypothetical protein KKE62_02025 [Proteobacteria bacterium]|nr:hypothetical protein [Pseudomonadota bacterium]MBU1387083.1 hypothetical protein [Pseudomonadota bacterium]MBU1541600.1 hypothetical protein [Pseudomonadota bacterium]MBU2482557.1 hypothetical protein [Pseudomonadota bacterium]